jgi:hypothetical protein
VICVLSLVYLNSKVYEVAMVWNSNSVESDGLCHLRELDCAHGCWKKWTQDLVHFFSTSHVCSYCKVSCLQRVTYRWCWVLRSRMARWWWHDLTVRTLSKVGGIRGSFYGSYLYWQHPRQITREPKIVKTDYDHKMLRTHLWSAGCTGIT